MRLKRNIRCCAAQFAITPRKSAGRSLGSLPVAKIFPTNQLMRLCLTTLQKASNRSSSWARSPEDRDARTNHIEPLAALFRIAGWINWRRRGFADDRLPLTDAPSGYAAVDDVRIRFCERFRNRSGITCKQKN